MTQQQSELIVTRDHPALPARDQRGHKGTFGSVLIVGGSVAGTWMGGAPALAALGALRAGCGLVRVAVPAPLAGIMLSLAPECMVIPLPMAGPGVDAASAGGMLRQIAAASDAVVVGPGLGDPRQVPGVSALVSMLVASQQGPVVVDADALSAIAQEPWLVRSEAAGSHTGAVRVLTPHVGEFGRLAQGAGMDARTRALASGSDAERAQAAAALAKRTGAIVVLKGAGTVVADGTHAWINTTGSSVLATAGSGDVLAGIIGGLLAQARLSQAERAGEGRDRTARELACAGAWAHGWAGDAWTAQSRAGAGMLASEILTHVPPALELLRTGGVHQRVAPVQANARP